MTLYPRAELSSEDHERFAKSISRLPLSSVIDKVTITEELGRGTSILQARKFKIRIDFWPAKDYTEEYAIKIRDVAESLEKKFCPRLQKVIKADLKKKIANKSLSTASSASVPTVGESSGTIEQTTIRNAADNEGGRDDDESDDGEDEDDATYAKKRGRRADSVEFDAPDDDEQAITANLQDEGSEDETYGGSPKPSRAPVPESDTDEVEDEDTIAAREEASDIRRERILKDCADMYDFKFDDKAGGYAELFFEFPASAPKFLMLHHVEATADFATVHVIPGIKSAMVSFEKVKDPATGIDKQVPIIAVEGTNLVAMQDYPHIIDTTRLFTNDIVSMLKLYGVEACRSSIVAEMASVFGGHGISVDNRHLNLIADAMTKGGGFSPFNRNGIMKSNVSPFMKMSYETTVGFLRDTVLENDWDDLNNPSARIVIGRLGGMGTGSFDVLAPAVVHDPLLEEVDEEPVDAMDVDAEESVEV